MKNKILYLSVISALSSPLWVSAADFTNGGFELGNTSGWTTAGGTWNGSPAAPLNPDNYTSGSGSIAIVQSTTSDSYITQYNAINNTIFLPFTAVHML